MEPEHWRAVVSPQVKSLFGRPLRVLLGTWFVSREMAATYLQEAEQAMARFGEAPSGVGTELRTFVHRGLLAETDVGRRVYFTPMPSPVWDVYVALQAAYHVWSEPEPASATDGSG